MWVKYDNFARHHSHSNALQPLPWCWKRPKLGPNICSFRLSGFRRSHPPTLVPPATCVHSWPKKVTTSALWKRMLEVASGCVIQLCMYYHDLSWPINHVVYMIIHVYLYCQDLHQIAVFYTTMRMLIHSSFEIARGPMDINNNKGCLHPLMLWEEGILIFMILVWVPWLLHFFFWIMDGGASPGCVFLRLRCFFLDKSLYGQEMQNLNLNPSLAFGRSG